MIRCRHEAGQRLYTRPGSLIQAPNGHLIGSPKICIDSTNMEEDKSILPQLALVDKPPRQNNPKWGGVNPEIRNKKLEILNKFKIGNQNDQNRFGPLTFVL